MNLLDDFILAKQSSIYFKPALYTFKPQSKLRPQIVI